jgi:salicylate hydroxylase
VGEGAHPLPVSCVRQHFHKGADAWFHHTQPGALQSCAMAVEDGAVLAKLFSHLLSEDQIESFLWAYQDLRTERVSRMLHSETKNIFSMTLPPGDIQQMRDQSMRDKQRAGKNVLEGEGGDIAEQWEEIKLTFGYDAEDEADNWWVKWGLLRERARGLVSPTINWNNFIQSVEVDTVVVS